MTNEYPVTSLDIVANINYGISSQNHLSFPFKATNSMTSDNNKVSDEIKTLINLIFFKFKNSQYLK